MATKAFKSEKIDAIKAKAEKAQVAILTEYKGSKGLRRIFRRVGVGAYFQHRVFAGQLHELSEVAAQIGGLRSHLAEINFARRCV